MIFVKLFKVVQIFRLAEKCENLELIFNLLYSRKIVKLEFYSQPFADFMC